MPNNKPLNLAIIGLGHLHPRLYMPLFDGSTGAQAVAVCEPDAQLRDAFVADYGVKGYADLDTMLAQEQLDIAAIFLPHVDCPAAAVTCAQKGLHLMVEKPMAASARQAQLIVDAAAKNNVKLTTGYCWRLHPVARQIKQMVQDGALGRIVGAEGRLAAGRVSRYIDGNSAWMLQKEKSGGGPMVNLGVHWIDLLTWILEQPVTEVSGRNVKINTEYDIEDNSFAHLQFADGMIAALDVSYTVPDSFPYGRDLYIALRGTKGVVSWAPAYEGEKDTLVICSDDETCSGAGRREYTFELDPEPGYSGYMGRQYVRQFVDCIRNNTPAPISATDAVHVLEVVQAVYQSHEKKSWVSI